VVAVVEQSMHRKRQDSGTMHLPGTPSRSANPAERFNPTRGLTVASDFFVRFPTVTSVSINPARRRTGRKQIMGWMHPSIRPLHSYTSAPPPASSTTPTATAMSAFKSPRKSLGEHNLNNFQPPHDPLSNITLPVTSKELVGHATAAFQIDIVDKVLSPNRLARRSAVSNDLIEGYEAHRRNRASPSSSPCR